MEMWGGFREGVVFELDLAMGRFVEMTVGMIEESIWAVGAMGIQDWAQSIVNGQGEA